MKYKAICGELYGRVHAILPEKLHAIQQFIEARNAGITVDGEAVPRRTVSFVSESVRGGMAEVDAIGDSGRGKFVAVLPLFGTTWQHGGMEMAASGGTSTEQFAGEFRRLVAAPAIKTILIEVHSPGGQVWGTEELSDVIYSARRSDTRIVAAVNSMCASAALWIATAASEINITPGGEMGSIGVAVLHEDISGAEEKAGIRTTLIAHPPKKVDRHPYAPLGDDVRAEIESEIKSTYQSFVAAVARNRGVSTSAVEGRFGGGGMLRAQQAVAAGLADRVATKSQVLGRELRLLSSSDDQPRRSVRNRIAML